MTRIQIILVTWLSAITVAVGLFEWRRADASPPPAAVAQSTSATFDHITVHRIDVVEPSGKPRVIISNADRYPGAYFSGKEYPHKDRTQTGGLLFYNDDGTEAGGLAYASDKHSAGAMLTMDQYNQNETMKLSYEEENGKRGAGLIVYGDHPSASLEPLIAATDELAKATTDVERAQIKARIDKLSELTGGDAGKRVFVGREGDDALVFLADKTGSPRIVMQVDAKGDAHLDFFDANGHVVKSLGAPPK
jgi:hypothetical protein